MMIDLSPVFNRNRAKHYIVACSSGIDSMVLLAYLQTQKFSFSVAHVNYKLRDAESDGDAKFIQDYCANSGINFHLKTVTLKKHLNENHGNLQQEARNIRYAFLREIQKGIPESLVVTAHHQNDQIETFILQLLRNSGMAGLAGMVENNGWLFRPFLSLSRTEIIQFAKENNVPWREDRSNAELNYARNALRNKVLPDLLDQFPELESNVLCLQSIFKGENESITSKAQKKVSLWKKNKTIPFHDLLGDSNEMVACFKLLGIDPRFIPSILSLCFSENNKGIDFKNNLEGIKGIKKWNNSLIFWNDEQSFPFRFVTASIEKLPTSFDTLCWYLDPRQLKHDVQFSLEHSHDTFVPIGIKSPKRVNQILKDARIPESKRKNWPVLISGNDIIGIPGICLNSDFVPPKDLLAYLRITFIPC